MEERATVGRVLAAAVLLLLLAARGRADTITWQGAGAGGTGNLLDAAGSPGVAWGGKLPTMADDAIIDLTHVGTTYLTTVNWGGARSLTVSGAAGSNPYIRSSGYELLRFGDLTINTGRLDLRERSFQMSGNLLNHGLLYRSIPHHAGMIFECESFVNYGTVRGGHITIAPTGAAPSVNYGTIELFDANGQDGAIFGNLVNKPGGAIRVIPTSPTGSHCGLQFLDGFANEGLIDIQSDRSDVALHGDLLNNGTVQFIPTAKGEFWYLSVKGNGQWTLPQTVKVSGPFDNQLTNPALLDLTQCQIRGNYLSGLEAASTGDSMAANFAIGSLVGEQIIQLFDNRNNTSKAGQERLVVRDLNAAMDMKDVPMTVTGSFRNHWGISGGQTELKVLGMWDEIGFITAEEGLFRLVGMDTTSSVLRADADFVVQHDATLDVVGCHYTDIAGTVRLEGTGETLPSIAGVRDLHGGLWVSPSGRFETQGGLTVHPGGTLDSDGRITVNGDLVALSGATLDGNGTVPIRGNLIVQDGAGVAGRTLEVAGGAEFHNTSGGQWTAWNNVHEHRPRLVMIGGTGMDPTRASSYAALEVCGKDLGSPTGWRGQFDENSYAPIGVSPDFYLEKLTIGPGAHVKLVDLIDNLHRGGLAGHAEALYVYEVAFADAAGRLYLNDIHLYCGAVTGDSDQIVSFVPEPATVGLLAMGGACVIAGAARRGRRGAPGRRADGPSRRSAQSPAT